MQFEDRYTDELEPTEDLELSMEDWLPDEEVDVIIQRLRRLLVGAQLHYLEHVGRDPGGVQRCRLCFIYIQDWWD